MPSKFIKCDGTNTTFTTKSSPVLKNPIYLRLPFNRDELATRIVRLIKDAVEHVYNAATLCCSAQNYASTTSMLPPAVFTKLNVLVVLSTLGEPRVDVSLNAKEYTPQCLRRKKGELPKS